MGNLIHAAGTYHTSCTWRFVYPNPILAVVGIKVFATVLVETTRHVDRGSREIGKTKVGFGEPEASEGL